MSSGRAFRVAPVDPDVARRAHAMALSEVERHSRSETAAFNSIPGAFRMAQFMGDTGKGGKLALDSRAMGTFQSVQQQRESQNDARVAIAKRGIKLNPDGSRVSKARTKLVMSALPQMTRATAAAEEGGGGGKRAMTVVGGTPALSPLAALVRAERDAQSHFQEGSFKNVLDKQNARRKWTAAKKAREAQEAKGCRNRKGRGRERAHDLVAVGCCARFFKRHNMARRTSVIVVGALNADLEAGLKRQQKKNKKKQVSRTAADKAALGAGGGTRAEREIAAAAAEEISLAKRKAASAAVREFGLSQRELRVIKDQFELIDNDHSGDIDYGEFFHFIDEKPSPYTDAFFDLIDFDNNGCIDFDEFLVAMSTFALYTEEEILRFCFRTFDKDESGDIDDFEFAGMRQALHNDMPLFPGNFHAALAQFDCNDDGLIDFGEFKTLARSHPMLFYPAMRLQDKLQGATLGAKGWVQVSERVQRRKDIMKYRRRNKGRMPVLSWRQELDKFMNARCPNELAIQAELRQEAREKGLPPPPHSPPLWRVAWRHFLAYSGFAVLVAAVLALVGLAMMLGWNIGPFSVYVHDPACRARCFEPSPCRDRVFCCQGRAGGGTSSEVCYDASPLPDANGLNGTKPIFACPDSVAGGFEGKCFCPEVGVRELVDGSTKAEPTDLCERIDLFDG
jgi:Ca2+-binding EF-hand superfamily protein